MGSKMDDIEDLIISKWFDNNSKMLVSDDYKQGFNACLKMFQEHINKETFDRIINHEINKAQ